MANAQTVVAGSALVLALAAVAVLDYLRSSVVIPPHLLNHPAVFVPELFDKATQTELLNVLKVISCNCNVCVPAFMATYRQHSCSYQRCSDNFCLYSQQEQNEDPIKFR
jgi:hypothetical protein